MNYLEEAGKWLGLESDNIVDESVANFSIAFSARDLKYKNNMNEATYMNEGLFKKSKTIDPKIEPKAAISKAITLIKKYSKKYTDIKNISDAKYDILNQQKNKETFYTDFINNKEDQIDLIVYDIEAKYKDRNQIINLIDKQLIPDVNYELNKVGYSVEITDINGSEVIIDLVKGATIRENYNFKSRGISMNTINKLVSLSESYNIKNSDRLRNDIVSEYTETINSLDSIDESVIAKDIRVLPVYKINEEEDFNDFLHKNYINEIVELKPVNEVLIADYDFVMSYNINFIERKMMPLSMLKRTKISFEKRLDNYETKLKEFKKMSDEEQKKVCRKINLGNGAYSTGMAVATTAVSNYASDGQYSLTYIEIPSTITPYNYPGVLDKMIKKMKYDIKKLDDIIKAKEKKKAMKESYAIDLDSLKYVVQNEHCTLEEAVQKIKDVNYIDDSYNISCVLPEGFNEQMTLDQFITLHNVLTEAGINLVWTKEVSENEFIQEAFSLENMRKKLAKGIDSFKQDMIDTKKLYDPKTRADQYMKNTRNNAVKFANETTNITKLEDLIRVYKSNLDIIKNNEKAFKNGSEEYRASIIKIYNITNAYGKGKNHTAEDVMRDYRDSKKLYEDIINLYEKRLKELKAKK